MHINRIGPHSLRQLNENALRPSDPDDEIRSPRAERAAEIGNRLENECGAIGAGLIEPGRRFPVVPRVEEVDRKNGERIVAGCGERFVVVYAEIAAEVEDCAAASGGDAGGIGGDAAEEAGRGREE